MSDKPTAKDGKEIKPGNPREDIHAWRSNLCDECIHNHLFDDETHQVCPVSLLFMEDTVLSIYEERTKPLELYRIFKDVPEASKKDAYKAFGEFLRSMVLGYLGDQFLIDGFVCKLFRKER